MLHKFVIHAPINQHEAFVEMDGKRLNGVTDIRFRVRATNPALITLTIMGEVLTETEFEETELIMGERRSPFSIIQGEEKD